MAFMNYFLGHRKYNSETKVNFDPKYNCQYHLLSSVPNLQNTLQQGIDIFEKYFER